MKDFYSKNYSRIVVLSWVILLLLLWMQYLHLSTLLEATLLLGILCIPSILVSLILSNVWLPKAMNTKSMKWFVFQFIGATLFIAFVIALGYQLIRWFGDRAYFPRSILLEENKSFITDFLFAIPSILVINFGFCGLRFYYEHIKLQRIHLETQLQALQSQINPHFMFNVLNHIHILMQTNVALASELLLQYADILRFQLYKGQCEKIRLEEEVQFLQNFVKIEQLRWGEKLKVITTWSMTDKNMEIPPLLLIPFIENAFKHVSHTVSTERFIKILLEQNEKEICLEISNSKSTLNTQKNTTTSGIGLKNTNTRLKLIYGEHYDLIIKNEKDTYYTKLNIWQK